MRQPGFLILLCSAFIVFGCSNNPEPEIVQLPVMQSVTGTISYPQRIALTPNAVVNVQLLDVSRADAPAILIAEQNLTSPGQVPVQYELMYNPDIIDSRMTYTVSAKIFEGGELRFITDTAYPVLTNNNGNTANLMLSAAGQRTLAEAVIAPTKWMLVSIRGEMPELTEEQTPFIKLDEAAGRIAGFSGCNKFNGGLENKDGVITLGPLATTMMACAGNADIETTFMQALGEVSGFVVNDAGLLTGLSATETVLVFEAAD